MNCNTALLFVDDAVMFYFFFQHIIGTCVWYNIIGIGLLLMLRITVDEALSLFPELVDLGHGAHLCLLCQEISGNSCLPR